MNPVEAMMVLGFIWGFLMFLFLLFFLMGEMKQSHFFLSSAIGIVALSIISFYTLGPGTMFMYFGIGVAFTFFTFIGYHFEKS